MEVREITAAEEKQRIARLILESLPDWFGIPEAREAVSYTHLTLPTNSLV